MINLSENSDIWAIWLTPNGSAEFGEQFGFTKVKILCFAQNEDMAKDMAKEQAKLQFLSGEYEIPDTEDYWHLWGKDPLIKKDDLFIDIGVIPLHVALNAILKASQR